MKLKKSIRRRTWNNINIKQTQNTQINTHNTQKQQTPLSKQTNRQTNKQANKQLYKITRIHKGTNCKQQQQ